MQDIMLETALDWRAVAAVADGATLSLSGDARQRVETASRIVSAIVESGVRAYGVNTGVGALADTVVDRPSQSRLSRNIILSHACGIGPLLDAARSARHHRGADRQFFAWPFRRSPGDRRGACRLSCAKTAFPMCPPKVPPAISPTTPISRWC